MYVPIPFLVIRIGWTTNKFNPETRRFEESIIRGHAFLKKLKKKKDTNDNIFGGYGLKI